MRREATVAIEKHMKGLYDTEETPTSVDMLTDKVEEEGAEMERE